MALRKRGESWQADAATPTGRIRKSFPTKKAAEAWLRDQSRNPSQPLRTKTSISSAPLSQAGPSQSDTTNESPVEPS